MNSRKHIQDELLALGSGLPLPGLPVQSVPPGYFDGLAASVLTRIKASGESATAELEGLSPLLAGLSRQSPLHVPAGYFAGLEQELPALMSTDTLSAPLASLDRTMPNTVPAGYFDGLAGTVLSRVRPAAPVVQMRRAWMRMAVAAVVAGIMAVGGLAYYNTESGNAAPTTAWVEKGLTNVSDSSLDDFIETTDAVHQGDVAQAPVHKAEVRTMMSDVSDNEMDAFLAQVPTDDEELLIIN
jgi:hypothetical protein